MLIILVGHIPENSWGWWIPAQFGPSDAAEMFVFCSGYAAAIAFGGSFVRAGFWPGTARVVYRIWQLYWSNMLMVVAAFVVTFLTAKLLGTNPVEALGRFGLDVIVHDPATALIGIMSLSWTPSYFDILPMYMVALALMPVVVWLAGIDLRYAGSFVVGLYLAAQLGLALPGSPWDADKVWYFNPFAWQLLFFIGFAFGKGWLHCPAFRPRLLMVAMIWVIIWIPIKHWAFYPNFSWLEQLHWILIAPAAFKTNEHLFRVMHILSVIYLCLWLFERYRHLMTRPWSAPVVKVGQQALPTFMTSMVICWSLGLVLDETGRNFATLAMVNIAGLGALVAVAYLVSWFKSEPWRIQTIRAEASARADVEPGPTLGYTSKA